MQEVIRMNNNCDNTMPARRRRRGRGARAAVVIVAAAMIALVALYFMGSGSKIEGTWETEDGNIVTFFENGTIYSENEGVTLRYIAEDGILVLKTFWGDAQSMGYSISGDTLTLISDGNSFQMHRVG